LLGTLLLIYLLTAIG